jgi:hypothetical protein
MSQALETPFPVFNFIHVNSIVPSVLLVGDKLLLHILPQIGCRPPCLLICVLASVLDNIASILDQVEAIDLVHDAGGW